MKGKVIALSVFMALPVWAGTATFAPPPPVKSPAPKVKVGTPGQVHKNPARKNPARRNAPHKEIVLPAPEFLYREQGIDEFEKEKEKLRREKELLQMKVEIARLRAELEKYRLAPEELKLKLKEESLKKTGQRVSPAAVSGTAQPPVNPQLELQKEYMRMQMERERLRSLERKLALLQNLFTGVMKVGDQRVAFDSMGRKYSVGSTVYGFQIVDVQDDGVVVAFGEQAFKVPISSGIPTKKKENTEFQAASPAPAPEEPAAPPMPMEAPPVPVQ